MYRIVKRDQEPREKMRNAPTGMSLYPVVIHVWVQCTPSSAVGVGFQGRLHETVGVVCKHQSCTTFGTRVGGSAVHGISRPQEHGNRRRRGEVVIERAYRRHQLPQHEDPYLQKYGNTTLKPLCEKSKKSKVASLRRESHSHVQLPTGCRRPGFRCTPCMRHAATVRHDSPQLL